MKHVFKVIAIDGPAGAGKSTVAKALAKRLNFSYLDTGAMYRALTLKALRLKGDLEDEDFLEGLAQKTRIDLKDGPNGMEVILDGEDVSADIRTLEVTNNTFYIARAPKVRQVMVKWQREIAGTKNVVVEGRDTTTVVFPDAAYKFYMDADLQERASRRIRDLKQAGTNVDSNQMIKEIKDRDHKDSSRSTGPLKKAAGAIIIDSTNLSIDQTVQKILGYIK